MKLRTKHILAGIVAVSLTAAALPGLAATAEHSCTRIVGYSTTVQWTRVLEPHVLNAEWEFQAAGSQSIEAWGPEDPAWDEVPVSSPCGETTRAIIQVATMTRKSDDAARQAIAEAIAGIRAHVPTASEIALVPVNGGPFGSVCTVFVNGTLKSVYSSVIYPQMVRLIGEVRGDNVTTPFNEFTVGSCSHYRDAKGHVTLTGATYLARTFKSVIVDGS